MASSIICRPLYGDLDFHPGRHWYSVIAIVNGKAKNPTVNVFFQVSKLIIVPSIFIEAIFLYIGQLALSLYKFTLNSAKEFAYAISFVISGNHPQNTSRSRTVIPFSTTTATTASLTTIPAPTIHTNLTRSITSTAFTTSSPTLKTYTPLVISPPATHHVRKRLFNSPSSPRNQTNLSSSPAKQVQRKGRICSLRSIVIITEAALLAITYFATNFFDSFVTQNTSQIGWNSTLPI